MSTSRDSKFLWQFTEKCDSKIRLNARSQFSCFPSLGKYVIHYKQWFRWKENRKTHLNFKLCLFMFFFRHFADKSEWRISSEFSFALWLLTSIANCFCLILNLSRVVTGAFHRFSICHFDFCTNDSPEAFLAVRFSCRSWWWFTMMLHFTPTKCV